MLDHARDPKTLLPARSLDNWAAGLGEERALGLSAIYRAVQLLADSIAQLPIQVERNGQVLDRSEVPSIIKRFNLEMDNQDFIEFLVLSLVLNGNAFVLVEHDRQGNPINLVPLPPRHVAVSRNEYGELRYAYNSKSYGPGDMVHIHRMRMPGALRGLGPIQAAAKELQGHIKTAEYGATYFDSHALPQGILTSDQTVSPEEAKLAKTRWYERESMSDVVVLGKGLKFEALAISPKEAQWLEAQQFSVAQIARLFGVPSSLMMAVLDGGTSQTYSNVEQDWLAFTRFTLMGYVRKIETALSEFTVRGQKVRLRVEGLLRSDTKSRYAGYEIAIRSRFMTVDEVRALEGLPALTEAQIDQIKQLEGGGGLVPTAE